MPNSSVVVVIRVTVDGPEFGHPFAAQITALKAGKPVVVRNGYEIDLLPPYSGPFCLEPDGTIAAVEPVYRDLDAALRTRWVTAARTGRLFGRHQPRPYHASRASGLRPNGRT